MAMATGNPESVGLSHFVSGDVIARSQDGSERILKTGDAIYATDTIITRTGGTVHFKFRDGPVIEVVPGRVFSLADFIEHRGWEWQGEPGIEEIQELLVSDQQDPSQELPATASGPLDDPEEPVDDELTLEDIENLPPPTAGPQDDGGFQGNSTQDNPTILPFDIRQVIPETQAVDTGVGAQFGQTGDQTGGAVVTGGNPSDIIISTGDSDTGAVTEDEDPDEDGLLETGGTLTVVDADGDGAFNTTPTFTSSTNPDGTNNAASLGTLTITTGGAWNYQVDNQDSRVQGLGEGETLVEVFTVATADGSDTETITVTINGTNDGAVITGADRGTVTEDGDSDQDPNTAQSISGDLNHTDIDRNNDDDEFREVSTPTTTTSGLGSYTVTGAGVWNYVLANDNPAVQALGADDSTTDTFTVIAEDGTEQVVTITINGTNDAAVITGADRGTVTEDGDSDQDPNTAQSISGDLNHTDIDRNNDDDEFREVSTPTTTTSGLGSYTVTGAGVWNYVLANDNPAVQALGADDSTTDTFTVIAEDGTEQVVTITINGTNDAAVITGADRGTVTEDGDSDQDPNTAQSISGDLNHTDIDRNNDDDEFREVSTPTTTTSGLGSYTVTGAGVWNYVLANDNPAVQALGADDSTTDTFTVIAEDGTEQVVTITINGTNDAAVITGADRGTVTEDGDSDQDPNTAQSISGDLNHTDIDRNNDDDEFREVSTPTTTTSGLGSYTVTGAGVWNYVLANDNPAVQALGADDSTTDTFTVIAEDGTEQVVTITINGTNDAAVITGADRGTVTEDGDSDQDPNTAQSISGDLNHTDIDRNNDDDEFREVSTPTTTTSGLGSYTVTGAGVWNYVLANDNPAVQALGADDSTTDTFTVIAEDGTEQVVTITINGTNDAAVITGADRGTVTEDGDSDQDPNTAQSISGDLNHTDIDRNNDDDEFREVSTPDHHDQWSGQLHRDRRGRLELRAGQ